MKMGLAAGTFLLVSVFAGSVSAAPLVPNENNDGIPDLNDAVNRVTGQSFGDNAAIQGFKIADNADQLWKVADNDVPLIGLTAGNINTLGYYNQGDSGNVNLTSAFSGFGFTGDGSLTDPYDGVMLIPDPTGNTIGFTLDSNGTRFYSEENLNPDQMDHLIAYDLSSFGPIQLYADFDNGAGATLVTFQNPVLLGWEDLLNGGDMDFDDTIYLADATPVPVPATLALLGAGLLGLGVMARRQR